MFWSGVVVLAILVLTLGIRFYEVYIYRKLEKELEAGAVEIQTRVAENTRARKEILREIGITEDLLDYALNHTRSRDLEWFRLPKRCYLIFQTPLGDGVAIEICKIGRNTYCCDVQDSQGRFSGDLVGLYICSDSPDDVDGNNIKVKELFELVKARAESKPQ